MIKPQFLVVTFAFLFLASCQGTPGQRDRVTLEKALTSNDPSASFILGAISYQGIICNLHSNISIQNKEQAKVKGSFTRKYFGANTSWRSGRISKVRLVVIDPAEYRLVSAKCSLGSILGTENLRFSFRRFPKSKEFTIPAGKVVSFGVIELKKETGPNFSWTSRPFNSEERADIAKLYPKIVRRMEFYGKEKIY